MKRSHAYTHSSLLKKYWHVSKYFGRTKPFITDFFRMKSSCVYLSLLRSNISFSFLKEFLMRSWRWTHLRVRRSHAFNTELTETKDFVCKNAPGNPSFSGDYVALICCVIVFIHMIFFHAIFFFSSCFEWHSKSAVEKRTSQFNVLAKKKKGKHWR